MKSEIFNAWKPQNFEMRSKVLFEKISYGPTGMAIELIESHGEKRPLSLEFSELPMAIRVANESLRLLSLPGLPPHAQTSFYIVENSRMLEWINAESLNIYERDPLFHLAIVTDEWIDIICNEHPTIVLRT